MSILPVHAHADGNEKNGVPGSFPENPSLGNRRVPRRRSTHLTVDTTAEPDDDDDEARLNGAYTTSPGSAFVPQPPGGSDDPASQNKKSSRRRRKPKIARNGSSGNRGAWTKVSEQLEDHDEKTVRSWNEQIDTLLVFAGLFSAVITEFNTEAYSLLQPDPSTQSNEVLERISVQLSSLPSAIRTGSPMPDRTPVVIFQPSLANVVVTALWYSSLVCALIAASLGMLVKQWLQHYLTDDYSSPREKSRIRQLRYSGLCQWQVPGIIAFLPLLLRIALTLFLAGLVVFIHALHPAVMWTVTPLIIAWLLSYSSSLILPSAFPNCPYKSPESLGFYIATRSLVDGFRYTLDRWKSGYITWTDPETPAKMDITLDKDTLATVDQTFADQALESIVRECCNDLDKESVRYCVSRILARRLQITKINASWSHPMTLQIARKRCFTRRTAEGLINIMVDTIGRVLDDSSFEWMTSRNWFTDTFDCLHFLFQAVHWPMDNNVDKALSQLMVKLMEAVHSPEKDSGYNNSALHRLFHDFVMQTLNIRPWMYRKDLLPLLPHLYMAFKDSFILRQPAKAIPIARAILSIIAHADPERHSQDKEFELFLQDWETAMPTIVSYVSTLALVTRDTVAHDIQCCRLKAMELGENHIAQDLCAKLEKTFRNAAFQSRSSSESDS